MIRSVKKKITLWFLLPLLCLGTAGCGTIANMPGVEGDQAVLPEKIPANGWWMLYQQGDSLAQAGSYHKALSLFRQAIARRDQDAWRAEVDHDHFVAYFPHREQGIIYFKGREYDKAIAELEASLAQEPSARATYFLDKARAARTSRAGSDRKPPVLILEGSSAREITKALTWAVKGVASDDTFVASITVNGRPVPMDTAEQKKIFSTDIPLAEGNNIIRFAATDLSGKSTEKTLSVYADRYGPQIEIEELTTADNIMNLRGNVSDDNGVASLKINGERWPITGNAPGYNFKLILPEGDISIVASDRAGNVTRAFIRRSEPDLQLMGTVDSPPPVPTDLLEEEDMLSAEEDIAPAAGLPKPPTVSARPYIRLDDTGTVQETYQETILLRGSVKAGSLLVYITVNGQEILNRRGREIFFSLQQKLREGKNVFHFVAADEYGNTAEKTITVNRRIPNIHSIDARMSMAILPFADTGTAGLTGGKFFTGQLAEAFRKQARFNMVAQNKIDTVLEQLQPAFSRPADPGRAADLGRAVDAQTVLFGTLIRDQDSLEIVGHLVDSESGRIITTNDLYVADEGTASPADLATVLAEKFKQDFPLLTGQLLKVEESGVRINLGTVTGLNPNSRFICYRKVPPMRHPVTGTLLESEPQILGRLEVEEIFKDSARARILSRSHELIATDSVIVQ